MALPKIEKDVPISNNYGCGRHNQKYPFGDMEINDSFFHESSKLRWAASAYGKKYGKKFTVRKDGDGYRCWRTA